MKTMWKANRDFAVTVLFPAIIKKITELGFSGYVCGCGTHIFLNGEELLCSRLDNALCRQVAALAGMYVAAGHTFS